MPGGRNVKYCQIIANSRQHCRQNVTILPKMPFSEPSGNYPVEEGQAFESSDTISKLAEKRKI